MNGFDGISYEYQVPEAYEKKPAVAGSRPSDGVVEARAGFEPTYPGLQPGACHFATSPTASLCNFITHALIGIKIPWTGVVSVALIRTNGLLVQDGPALLRRGQHARRDLERHAAVYQGEYSIQVADDRQQDQDEVDPAGRKQVFALGHYSMICVGLAQGIASAQTVILYACTA